MKYNFVRGGMLADKKTQIMACVGILSAIASYVVGDSDIFVMLQAIFTIGGILFIRKSDSTTKGS